MGPKPAVVACLLTVVLAACGTAERERDAAAVTELSAETVSKLEEQEEKPCDEAILGLGLPEGGTVAVGQVEVRSAYTRLAEGGADFLDEGPDGWKISAAGCRPTAPEQPYECLLEG